MELRHLRYFKAVAELLNFSRAAEQLRVAQPALSRQIQALEEELGARLLDRNRVSVRLTDAGRTFYGHTCKVLAQVDMATAAVREVTDGTRGKLRICNDWRMASEFVPVTVALFQAKHPQAEVILRDLNNHEQLAELRAREAHLGFVIGDAVGSQGELELLPVLKSRLFAVLPSKHRLAATGRKSVKLADLAEESWGMIDEKKAPGYRSFLMHLCRMSGFTPKFSPIASTIEGVFGRVASGYGVALAPENIVPKNGNLLCSLPTDCEPLEFCAVWHRQEKSVLLQQYLEILRHTIGQNSRIRKSPS